MRAKRSDFLYDFFEVRKKKLAGFTQDHAFKIILSECPNALLSLLGGVLFFADHRIESVKLLNPVFFSRDLRKNTEKAIRGLIADMLVDVVWVNIKTGATVSWRVVLEMQRYRDPSLPVSALLLWRKNTRRAT